eukprot:3019512-Prymnesium_polylepis.3
MMKPTSMFGRVSTGVHGSSARHLALAQHHFQMVVPNLPSGVAVFCGACLFHVCTEPLAPWGHAAQVCGKNVSECEAICGRANWRLNVTA